MMIGGVMPWGMFFTTVCEPAVIWAVAVRMSTFGWKKMRSTPIPAMEVDSMCSTSLTRVETVRSNGVITRPPMSSADRPVYDQAAAIDGTLMSGKMSAGVVTAAIAPKIKISTAMTMNVKGRCKAMRTMPFIDYSWARGGATGSRQYRGEGPSLRRL